MALNKHIWLSTIIENLYPDNSFASKSVDDSAFVNNHTVHVPNAGAPSGVKVNRATIPATSVGTRDDQDLTYDIDELTTDPVRIPNREEVELSYDKRASILANDRAALLDAAAQNLLYKWAVIGTKTLTTGASRAAHTASATGNRKKITKADVLTIATKFNGQNIPAEGRYLLLDAAMYSDLLDALTGTELSAFLASANAQKGIVGQLYGFNVMMRSQVLKVNQGKSAIVQWDATAAATDLAAGLAWQQSCVSRALGEVKMFDKDDDPLYYGDIYSFLVRTGGKYRRYDTKGVELLIEDNAAQ